MNALPPKHKKHSYIPHWARLRSLDKHNGGFFKALEDVPPWQTDPNAVVTEKHLYDLLKVQKNMRIRMHRATRAFIVMMTGPIWGQFIAQVAHQTIGIAIGATMTMAAGAIAAYYRGS